MKGCAAAVATAPIYLLAGSFFDPLPYGFVTREAFLGGSCDLVVTRVLFDLVVHSSSHFHASVDVPDGALDVVRMLLDVHAAGSPSRFAAAPCDTVSSL